MSDIRLVVGRCADCDGRVKGYVEEGGDSTFAHLGSVSWPHYATLDKESVQVIPYEIFHAIATAEQ